MAAARLQQQMEASAIVYLNATTLSLQQSYASVTLTSSPWNSLHPSLNREGWGAAGLFAMTCPHCRVCFRRSPARCR